MAQGLYTDDEDEAGGSPAASGDYSDSAGADLHDHDRPPFHPQPTPQAGQGVLAPGRQDASASRDVEREIAEALAADAAFLEDPSMTLREGALLPLEAGQEEGAYELPALSAGGTISNVSCLLGAVSHNPPPSPPPTLPHPPPPIHPPHPPTLYFLLAEQQSPAVQTAHCWKDLIFVVLTVTWVCNGNHKWHTAAGRVPAPSTETSIPSIFRLAGLQRAS